MDYETASVEEIAAHFGTISRQRISQVLKKYQRYPMNRVVVAKIQQAKAILKADKHRRKIGCTLAERKKCNTIWTLLRLRIGKHPAYLDCTNGFGSLEAFRLWAVRQVGFNVDNFELDKDILVKGNRIYSPDTCVFVPLEINSLLAGTYKSKSRGPYPIGVSFNKGSGTFVAQMSDRQEAGLDKYLGSFPTIEEAFACYKEHKEAKIKRLAEKWREHIDPRAYRALMARTVELDD